MRFPPEFIDEIRTRLPVSSVVGRRVKLKKAGREWRGLSPFNSEKTPSFFVNDSKMAWFDFSSGKNGNIFDFLMQTEGLSFPEAVERLARESGLELPRQTEEGIAREKKRAGLHEVLDAAASFFASRLAGRDGTKARTYLAERGISQASQGQFRIGYAPAERFALRDHLAGLGAEAATMIEAGLLVHGEDIKVPYDRFRDRVMFPIHDRSGRVIAFGGRALDKSVAAKYLNSPETPLFHKGAVLYNHHQARKAAYDKGAVIAVEGYVDVVSMAAVGFPNVVAACGTALTPDQCGLLWSMAPEPTLCFDGDNAGRRAAFKALETALPLIGAERSLRFAFLPDGQDPDDLARSGGATAVAAVLEAAKPLSDVLWLRETEGHRLETPEHRAALERRLGEAVRLITDETLRRHYQSAMRERLNALMAPARAARERTPAQATRGPGAPRFGQPQAKRGYLGAPLPPASVALSRSPTLSRAVVPSREALILTSLLQHPGLLDRHFDTVSTLDFENGEAGRLRDLIVHLSGDLRHDRGSLQQAIETAGLGDMRRHIETAAEKLPHWHLRQDASETDVDQILVQALTLHQKSRDLHRALRDAQEALAREPTDQHLALLRDVQERLSALNGTEASVEGFGRESGRPALDV